MFINGGETLLAQHQNGKFRDSQNNNTPSIWFSKRLRVLITLFLTFMAMIIGLQSLNFAVIEMTSDKLIIKGNLTVIRPAEFNWDPAIVGIITSLHAYAGLLSFCGSFFVIRLGGSTSTSLFLMTSGILTILTPASLYSNFYLFVLVRFSIGLCVIFSFVSIPEIFSRWFPKKERSSLISICVAGKAIGLLVGNPFSGYIVQYWGWPMVFYVSGTLNVILSLLCFIMVKNQPSHDKYISKEELYYILEETDSTYRKKGNHPYKAILSSMPVLAMCFGKFTCSWMETFFGSTLPLYIKDITQTNTDVLALISTIPIVASVIIPPISGPLMDYWKNHTEITFTRMHKIMFGIGFTTTSALFFGIPLFSDFTVSMIIFVLIQLPVGFIAPIFDILQVNIAPNHSSAISGFLIISNSMSIIISRAVTGLMTMNHTGHEWNNCFFLEAVVSIIAAVILLKYGSSEAQSWSLSTEEQRLLIKIENQR